jgi:hypothetical protein
VPKVKSYFNKWKLLEQLENTVTINSYSENRAIVEYTLRTRKRTYCVGGIRGMDEIDPQPLLMTEAYDEQR